jgi:hypothetical protein
VSTPPGTFLSSATITEAPEAEAATAADIPAAPLPTISISVFIVPTGDIEAPFHRFQNANTIEARLQMRYI